MSGGTEEMWMLLVLLYGVLKGAREIVKKKALTKSSVIEVLFFYTLLGFLFVTPQAPSAMGLEPKFLDCLKVLCDFPCMDLQL